MDGNPLHHLVHRSREVPKRSKSDQNDQLYRESHQLKLLSYGFIGGFYFSSLFRPWIKYTWFLTNFVVVMFAVPFGTVGYLTSSSTKTTADVIYAILMTNAELFFVCVIPSITYCFRQPLEEILNLNGSYFYQNRMSSVAPEIQKSNRTFVKLLALHTFFAVLYVGMHQVLILFSAESELQNMQIYVYPNSWAQSIQSRSGYYVLFLAQFAAASISFVSVIAFPMFIVVIGQEFGMVFSILKRFLEEKAIFIEHTYGQMIDQTMAIGTGLRVEKHKLIPEDAKKVENIGGESTMTGNVCLGEAILFHQVLRRKMLSVKPYIEILFSLALTIKVADQCFFVFILCSDKMDNTLKVKQLIVIAYIHVCLYTFCYVGKLFDEMEEMISVQLYSTPWYLLEPKQRKILHIFLCQTQKSIKYFALRIYIMNMPIVLQNLKMIFTLFNLLRQLLRKK